MGGRCARRGGRDAGLGLSLVRAILFALAGILASSLAQYLGVTEPALRSKTDAVAGLELAERTLDRREKQIDRRELRIGNLEDELETCLGRPIARGPTPALASGEGAK